MCVCVCVRVCVCVYCLMIRSIGIMVRVFVNILGDGSNNSQDCPTKDSKNGS